MGERAAHTTTCANAVNLVLTRKTARQRPMGRMQVPGGVDGFGESSAGTPDNSSIVVKLSTGIPKMNLAGWNSGAAAMCGIDRAAESSGRQRSIGGPETITTGGAAHKGSSSASTLV